MPRISDSLKRAVKRHENLPIWLTHMWQRQHEHHQLSLLLGAGVSIDAGCPGWKELVNRLAAEEGSRLENLSSIARTVFKSPISPKCYFKLTR